MKKGTCFILSVAGISVCCWLALCVACLPKGDGLASGEAVEANAAKGTKGTANPDFETMKQVELMEMEDMLFAGTSLGAIELFVNSVPDTRASLTRLQADTAMEKRSKAASVHYERLLADALPKLRVSYADILDEKLWEKDIEVSVSGKRKDVLTLTGGVFAANKNVGDFQTQIWDVVKALEFKRVNYKWYEGDTEYQYYDLSK